MKSSSLIEIVIGISQVISIPLTSVVIKPAVRPIPIQICIHFLLELQVVTTVIAIFLSPWFFLSFSSLHVGLINLGVWFSASREHLLHIIVVSIEALLSIQHSIVRLHPQGLFAWKTTVFTMNWIYGLVTLSSGSYFCLNVSGNLFVCQLIFFKEFCSLMIVFFSDKIYLFTELFIHLLEIASSIPFNFLIRGAFEAYFFRSQCLLLLFLRSKIKRNYFFRYWSKSFIARVIFVIVSFQKILVFARAFIVLCKVTRWCSSETIPILLSLLWRD